VARRDDHAGAGRSDVVPAPLSKVVVRSVERRSRIRAIVVPLLVLATGCAGASGPRTPSVSARTWRSTLDVGHPLVGRIWDVRNARYVSERELVGSLRGFVLLGEKHDNADHHALQAELLREMTRTGQKPAVAFEMFDLASQNAIDASRKARPRDADAIARAVAWETSGWPPWPLYAPIVKAALDADLPIVATGIARSEMRALVQASGPLPGEALGDDERAGLAHELVDSHCGQLPEAMVPGMMRVQRARDASMARALVLAGRGASGVLVAGTGHTRVDRGAGMDLRADPARVVVSVAFAEVEKGRLEPASYAERWHAKILPFDFVWFTPRASDEDPCAAMKSSKDRSSADGARAAPDAPGPTP